MFNVTLCQVGIFSTIDAVNWTVKSVEILDRSLGRWAVTLLSSVCAASKTILDFYEITQSCASVSFFELCQAVVVIL